MDGRAELLNKVMEKVRADAAFIGKLASFGLRPEKCAVWYRKAGYADIRLQTGTEPRGHVLYDEDEGQPVLFIEPGLIQKGGVYRS